MRVSISNERDGLIQYDDGYLDSPAGFGKIAPVNPDSPAKSKVNLSTNNRKEGTFMSSVINLTATAMGAGILALPNAMSELGIGLGLALLLFFAIMSDISLVLLVDCSRITRRFSFEGVGEEACGRWGKLLVKCTLLLFLFGSVILLMTIFGQLISESLKEMVAESDRNKLYVDQTFIMGVVSAAIFPMCLAKNISILKYTSGMGLLFLLYVIVMEVIFFFSESNGNRTKGSVHSNMSVVKYVATSGLGLPLLYTPYASQFNIFKIYDELAVQQEMNKVIHTAIICVVTSLYIIGAIFGYITWGPHVNANLLLEYPNYMPATIGRLAIGFTNVLKLPLIVMPFRQSLLRSWAERGHDTRGFIGIFVMTLLIMGVCFYIAFALSSIQKELELLGSTAGAMCCFILPAGFYLKLSYSSPREFENNSMHKCKLGISWLMFISSILIGLYAFILSLIYWNRQ